MVDLHGETLSAGGNTALNTMDGCAGQTLVFDSLLQSSPADWVIYNPDNQFVASFSLNQDQLVTLSQSGPHLLAIASAESFPANYSFNLRIVASSTTPIEFRTVVAGDLERPGTEVRYTFTGHPGMRIYYDGQATDSSGFVVRLLDPLNTAVFDGYSVQDNGPHLLQLSGTYTLVVGGAIDPPGQYQFRILDLASATEWTGLFSGQLDPPTARQLLRFPAMAGQRVLLEQLNAWDQNATWQVVVILVGPRHLIARQQLYPDQEVQKGFMARFSTPKTTL